MKNLFNWAFFLALVILNLGHAYAQRGAITKPATTTVMDPDQDGYISMTTDGFSNDGFYPDEFEFPMFAIPAFGSGEALGDNQVGPNCGSTDLTVDTEGHSVYAILDDDNNLIFRFRVADERNSVEAYSILIDTDGLIGDSDPNATADNPGFEIDITLIKSASKGVTVYNIDGIESCPTEVLAYDYDTNFQISIAGILSCGDADYFYDFYVPFGDLTAQFGITVDSKLQFAALTNISGTCAMGGAISDIGGVDDGDYAGCNTCAFLDLASDSCPVPLSNLCSTCEGFLSGATPQPTMDVPLKEGDNVISGTAAPEAEIFLDVFSFDDTLVESVTAITDVDSLWSLSLTVPLVQGDSVTAVAQTAGSCDSGAAGSTLSFAVVVLNTPPVLSGTSSALSYNENDVALPVDPAILVTDNEDVYLQSAVISITGNFLNTEDELTFTDQPGITGSYDAGTGVLTLTGEATLADYQTALASLGYSNSSDNPNESTRTVSFVVNDRTEDSNVFTRDIEITKINDAPVIAGTSGSSTEYTFGAPMVINSTITITDVDNTQLAGATVIIGNNFASGDDLLIFVTQNGISGIYDPLTGELTLSGAATLAEYATALSSIQYENTGAIELTRRFDYTVTDGMNESNVFSHFLFMTVTNTNPVIVDADNNPIDDLLLQIDEDGNQEYCILAIDPEGDLVIIDNFVEGTGNGTITLTGGLCFGYEPDPDFFGDDSFLVTVCDQNSPSLCDNVNVTITVNPINDPSIVQSFTLDVDEKTTSPICAQFTDIENDDQIFSTGSSVTGIGSVSDMVPGDICFDYTPPDGFIGEDVVEVTICDAVDGAICSSGTITVNVIDINESPIILVNGLPEATVTLSTFEDTLVDYCFEVVDPEGDVVSLNLVTNQSGGGSLTPDPTAFCFGFMPMADFNGQSIWEIEICDDNIDPLCGTLILIVDVTPVNDPPEVQNITVDVNEKITSEICIQYTDIETDDHTFSSGTSTSAIGLISDTVTGDVCFNYTPPDGFIGEDVIEVTICDATDGSVCSSGTITINVLDVNESPVFLVNGIPSTENIIETQEDTPLNYCFTVVDPEGDIISINAINNQIGGGSLNGDATDFCFDFMPTADFNGQSIWEIEICDDNVAPLCGILLLTVNVTSVDDAPILNGISGTTDYPWESVIVNNTISITDIDDTAIEGASVTIGDNFVNGEDVLEFINQNGISGNYDASTGVLTLSGTASLVDYQTALSSVQYLNNGLSELTRRVDYVVNDGEIESNLLSQFISIVILNNAPIIETSAFELSEDTSQEFCVSVNDVDNDMVNLTSLEEISLNGSISLNDNLCFQYTPEQNFNGENILTITVCDEGVPSLCDEVTIVLTVLPVNDAPTTERDILQVTRNEESQINVIVNDSDLENDAISLATSPETNPLHGIAILNADGTVSYTSDVTYRGLDSLVYKINDNGSPSMSALGVIVFDIEDEPFTVYQAISPNNDGINDSWFIEGIDYYPKNKVRLYDRYNNLVYEQSGYNNVDKAWSGQSKKGQLPDGTYFYFIDLGQGDDKSSGSHKGFLVLKNN